MKPYTHVLLLSLLSTAVHLGCAQEAATIVRGSASNPADAYKGGEDAKPADKPQNQAPAPAPVPVPAPSRPPVVIPDDDDVDPRDSQVGSPVSNADVLSEIQRDSSGLLAAEASKTRYFSLQAVNNAGATFRDLETQRLAFKKVLNSLSNRGGIVLPEAIDSAKLIYRVDLDDIGMSAAEFDQVIADHYPFSTRFVDDGTADGIASEVDDDSIRRRLQTNAAIIRMDWFNATALLPNIYRKFMRFPNTLAAFEQEFLGASRLANIQANDVTRIAFDEPEVAQSNRVLEHHDGINGGFYVFYDFVQAKQGQIFAAPLGPRGANARVAAQEFQEDFRSVLFTLRNGLYGSFMANIQGQAVDKAPINVLRQANGPADFSLAMVNGQSMISLFHKGMPEYEDTMLNGVAANRNLFNNADISRINTMYRPDDFLSEVERDNANYEAAMNRMGIKLTDPDPVDAAYRFYTRPMKLEDVLAETGLSERDFRLVLVDPEFSGTLNSLNNPNGTISRAVFQSVYPQLIETFSQQLELDAPNIADFVVTADCMLDNATRMDTCIIQQ